MEVTGELHAQLAFLRTEMSDLHRMGAGWLPELV